MILHRNALFLNVYFKVLMMFDVDDRTNDIVVEHLTRAQDEIVSDNRSLFNIVSGVNHGERVPKVAAQLLQYMTFLLVKLMDID